MRKVTLPDMALRRPTGFSHDSCSGNKRALRSVASERNRYVSTTAIEVIDVLHS